MERGKGLIKNLKKEGVLVDLRLEKALQRTPVDAFLPSDKVMEYYSGNPALFYRHGDFTRTLPAPSMLCIMIQELELREGMDVLILGAKSGYLEALISEMVGDGFIYVLDSNPAICEITEENLLEEDYERGSTVLVRDPLFGYPEKGPWDRILITGQIPRLPREITNQLSEDGFALAPIGPYPEPEGRAQEFTRIWQDGSSEPLGEVVFGPLKSEYTGIEEEKPEKSGLPMLQVFHASSNGLMNRIRKIVKKEHQISRRRLERGIPYSMLLDGLLELLDGRKELAGFMIGPGEAKGKRSNEIRRLRPLPLFYIYAWVCEIYKNGYRKLERSLKQKIKLSKKDFGENYVASRANVKENTAVDYVTDAFNGYFNLSQNRKFTERLFQLKGPEERERIIGLGELGREVAECVLEKYFKPHIPPPLDPSEAEKVKRYHDIEKLHEDLKKELEIKKIPEYRLE